jgi:hypothetical protein
MTEKTGQLVLHPTHWLWKGGPHPACPVCRREILPLTPVVMEDLDDGRTLVVHEECHDNEVARR